MNVTIDANVATVLISMVNLVGLVITGIFTMKNHALTLKVEKATNSIMTEHLAATAAASQSKGRREGIAEERANPQVSAHTVPVSTHAEPVEVKVIPDQPIPVVPVKPIK